MPAFPSIVSRGVYYLPWVGSRGERFLAAIDRHGRRVCEAAVEPGKDPQPVVAFVRRLLDEHDPPGPPLRAI